jgi:ribonuclease E
MAKRMLIDATHAEETRVVVLEGNRLEDFDVETQSRRQLKGNIYLAKVVRVEPSLQAAFVEYGGNRHGFLAFGEIHPDYYQIPVADRQRLLQMQEEEARAEEEAEDEDDFAPPAAAARDQPDDQPPEPLMVEQDLVTGEAEIEIGVDIAPEAAEPASDAEHEPAARMADTAEDERPVEAAPDERPSQDNVQQIEAEPAPPPETLGGETDHAEEGRERRAPSRYLRNYKIQEVIRRRQILLVQVVKEERGTKGAALTTYISLAGRYCVLMPNSPRGGGISRKITSATDRRRLKEVTTELQIPRGMGLIVRTAGANRPKPEIKRDCEYLLRLWDEIRELTLRSVAPALIYEEASLIKRAIRDVYSRDVDEVLVDGEDGWKAARDFMRMLMPTHVKKVQLWRADGAPLFSHQQVEAQLDAMLSPTVQLRSGGYLVINQTEALVAIDVNSGRSTRERGIEETALRTNLEAADEAARQLRLRDLAGLIVIDFIDMESKKNNAAVERRMKEALKDDRARIQIGNISHFGLMEISRQRLRPSLAETSLTACTHCGGAGYVRSTESAALHVLRAIEEEGGKRRASEILVHLNSAASLYLLNNKRRVLAEIEARYGLRISFAADDSLLPAQTRIERLRAYVPPEVPLPVSQTRQEAAVADDTDSDVGEADDEDVDSAEGAGDEAQDRIAGGAPDMGGEEGERKRKRRRRRRGRGNRPEDGAGPQQQPAPIIFDGTEQPDFDHIEFPGAKPVESIAPVIVATLDSVDEEVAPASVPEEPQAKTRGKRGGRRRASPKGQAAPVSEAQPDLPPPYVGPTPADPFANGGMDIFDLMDMAEARHTPPPAPPAEIEVPLPVRQMMQQPAAATIAIVEAPPPAAPEADPEPVAGPLIKPMLIDGAGSVAEKKKGWWRR